MWPPGPLAERELSPQVVIATCRSPDTAPELAAAVAAGAAGSRVLPCDVTDAASVAALAARTKGAA